MYIICIYMQGGAERCGANKSGETANKTRKSAKKRRESAKMSASKRRECAKMSASQGAVTDASIASGSTECEAVQMLGRSASIVDGVQNAFFQDPLEAFSGSGDVCAGEVIRAAFQHETRDLMAAYQVVVKLVVKLVVDVRGGEVVQAAFEHETRDLTAAYQVLSACG
jgi:hypothetical protein